MWISKRHNDSKTVHSYGLQYIIVVQECMEMFAGYH
jgi:hypothetical protein